MEESSEGRKIFTTRAVTLSLIFGLFMLFSQTVMRSAAGYSWTGEAALVVLVITYALSTIGRRPLSLGEMGLIFGSVEVVTVLFIGWQYMLPSWAIAALSENFPLRDILPEFLVPKDQEALRALLLGGQLRWDAWILPLSFAVLFAISLSLLSYFTVIPFRKFYLEKERLIFPVASVAASFSRLVRERGYGLKLLWLGLLVGFTISSLQRSHLFQTIWEGFPAVDLRFDLTPYLQDMFPGGAFGMDPGVQITPDLLAWAFLIPLEIQTSIWVTSIVAYLLVPPVLVRLGLLPYETGRDFSFYTSIAATEGPLPWYHISTGLYLAVGLVPIILGYRYLRDSWRAWEDQPVSRVGAVLGWIATFALSILLISALGMSPVVAALIVVLHMMYWHGYVWTIGMGNWIIPIELGVRGIVDSVFLSSGALNRSSPDAFFAGASSAMISETSSAQPTSAMEGFKYSASVGMRAREMFKGQVMGLLFGSIIGGLLLLVASHSWGAAMKPLQIAEPVFPLAGLTTALGELGNWRIEFFLEGFGIGALVFLLRGLVPWLTVSSVGVLLGLLLPQYAAMYMITSVMRYAAERYGGEGFVRSRAVPFMAGFAIGGVLNILITSLVLMLKASFLRDYAPYIGILLFLMVFLPVLKAYTLSANDEERQPKDLGNAEGEVG